MLVTNLKLFRVKKGLKLKEAAQAIGLHPTWLSRLECGQSWVPPHLREKLANFYGVPVEEICDLETGWPILVNRPKPEIVRKEG